MLTQLANQVVPRHRLSSRSSIAFFKASVTYSLNETSLTRAMVTTPAYFQGWVRS